jgi:hypothetical protein
VDRLHAPEFEDFGWFPASLRDALTDMLRAMASTFGLFDAALSRIDALLAESGAERIIDLCSGAGGPLLGLADRLVRPGGRTVPIVLTDKFPNLAAFARAEAERPGQVSGHRAAVDATAVPPALHGLRTLFNALHHFPPPRARAILEDARRQRQPIACFEVVERSASGALMVLSVAPLVWALTPTLEPRSLRRFALTYGVPLVPALTAWDGFASCLRAYSVPELERLVEGLSDDAYAFRVERVRHAFLPLHVTALLGAPRGAPLTTRSC